MPLVGAVGRSRSRSRSQIQSQKKADTACRFIYFRLLGQQHMAWLQFVMVAFRQESGLKSNRLTTEALACHNHELAKTERKKYEKNF